MSLFDDINFGAVLIAAITKVIMEAFGIRHLYRGKRWMRESGLTEEDFKKGHPIWLMAILSLSFAFCCCYGNSLFYHPRIKYGIGRRIWGNCFNFLDFCFKGEYFLFEQNTIRHYLINAGYDICSYTVMGAILGAWH